MNMNGWVASMGMIPRTITPREGIDDRAQPISVESVFDQFLKFFREVFELFVEIFFAKFELGVGILLQLVHKSAEGNHGTYGTVGEND